MSARSHLYGMLPPTEIGQLPFTYPPFAAVVFSPLTLVPYQVASLLWTLLAVRSRLAAGGVALFMLAPQWWSGWLALPLGNAYVWCGIGVLVWWSADRQLRRARVHVDHRAVA